MSRQPERRSAHDRWWRSSVLYQVYPRSFADADGDGQGDLQGVIDHLDHLTWLGVDGLWLNPIMPSPNADWGYDVSDYTSVDPDFGDLATLDRLVKAAGDRGIRVILDLVPNHTSDRHPWFLDARTDRSSSMRDRYVWADPGADGGPPNNWMSTFGGPAWTLDDPTGQYYLHNFLPEQPDLNWWNEDVRDAFDDITRFWFDRGVAGFRIDVAHGIVKDRELRDNPPADEDDPPDVRERGYRAEFNMHRDDVHEVLRRWRTVADAYDPPKLLFGETWVMDIGSLMRFYGGGTDELDLALNVPFIFATPGEAMQTIVERTEAMIPPAAWPTWTGSNHDAGRFPTRWCGDDERKIRAAMLMLLTLRGTPVLYYGDEIGMPQVDVPRDRLRDPVGVRGWPREPGRDRSRTPMRWTGDASAGFTRAGVEPWLPIGDVGGNNVADQRDTPGSVLHLCRDVIALRRAHHDLADGAYAALDAPPGVWAWQRGSDTVVAVNHSDDPVELETGSGRVAICTARRRDGERVDDRVRLDPWEALVLVRG
jgi:alpha-glucosidase